MKTIKIVTALAAGLFAHAAQAILVEWSFDATIESVSGDQAVISDYGFVNGLMYSVSIVVDTDTPATPNGALQFFEGAVVGVSILGNSYSASLELGPGGFSEVVSTVGPGGSDVVGAVAGLVMDNGVFSEIGFMALQVVDSDAMLVDDLLSPWFPDFSAADGYNNQIPDGTFFSFGNGASNSGEFFVDTSISNGQVRVVPVPAAIYFLFSGICALAAVKRRRAS